MKYAVAVAIALSVSVVPVFGEERTWSRSKILAIADNEAQRLGYDIEQMSVSYDFYNSQWHDYLKAFEAGNQPTVTAKLKDRQYWAVYYGPMRHQMGGDLTVFIDRETGEVIAVMRGE